MRVREKRGREGGIVRERKRVGEEEKEQGGGLGRGGDEGEKRY